MALLCAAHLKERPMSPVRIETEADVLGAIGVEKVEAAQEDPLPRRTLWQKSAARGLARHSAMLHYESLEVLKGMHRAKIGSIRISVGEPLLLVRHKHVISPIFTGLAEI